MQAYFVVFLVVFNIFVANYNAQRKKGKQAKKFLLEIWCKYWNVNSCLFSLNKKPFWSTFGLHEFRLRKSFWRKFRVVSFENNNKKLNKKNLEKSEFYIVLKLNYNFALESIKINYLKSSFSNLIPDFFDFFLCSCWIIQCKVCETYFSWASNMYDHSSCSR